MPLNDRDYDLLSAYLDGALDTDERRMVESRLARDAEYRRELDALRQTVALVKAMPELISPRDLRLTRKMVEGISFETPKVRRSRTTVIRTITNFAAAAASLTLVLAGALTLLSTRIGPPVSAPVPVAMLTITAEVRQQSDTSDADDLTLMSVEAAESETAKARDEAAEAMLLQATGTPLSTQDRSRIAPTGMPESAAPGGIGGDTTDDPEAMDDGNFFEATTGEPDAAAGSMMVSPPTQTVQQGFLVTTPASPEAAAPAAPAPQPTQNAVLGRTASATATQEAVETMLDGAGDSRAVEEAQAETAPPAEDEFGEAPADLTAVADTAITELGAQRVPVEAEAAGVVRTPLGGLALVLAGLVLGAVMLARRARGR